MRKCIGWFVAVMIVWVFVAVTATSIDVWLSVVDFFG